MRGSMALLKRERKYFRGVTTVVSSFFLEQKGVRSLGGHSAINAYTSKTPYQFTVQVPRARILYKWLRGWQPLPKRGLA